MIEKQTDVHEARDRLPADPPPLDATDLEGMRKALRSARSRLNDYRRASLHFENLWGQLSSLTGRRIALALASTRHPMFLPVLLGLIAPAVLLLGGLYAGQKALLLVVTGVLALFAAAGYLAFTSALARNVREAKASEKIARENLLDAVRPLELDFPPTADLLDNTEASLDAASEALFRWENARNHVEEANRALTTQEQRVEAAVLQVQAALKSEAKFGRQWKRFLIEKELPDSLIPGEVTILIANIETGLAKRGQVQQMRKRVAAIEVDIEEFRRQVQPLAENHGILLDSLDPRQVARTADALIDRLKEVQDNFSRRQQARQMKEQQEQQLQQLDKRTSVNK